MSQPKTPLLAHRSFSRGPANVVISKLDMLALRALNRIGGAVSTPADLGEALDGKLDNSRKALLGGRHLRRLVSVGFVKALDQPNGGYQITVTGRAAASSED
ncbi:hypothetical protein H8F21_15085 [Pseudomonas sp. P66]|uniref:Transcriptional regulator n=1 Tax=Pseudomonas arcuscaelestis TaxID=2710591 RepID=A0ABS2BZ70_9PSED|nr:hypothetical protein [Pseudomonas arcuscaelestis]MBM5458889.1 hypothetical protein [Pseudomonas arcuscaelestis]